jgi:hypothetical protein
LPARVAEARWYTGADRSFAGFEFRVASDLVQWLQPPRRGSGTERR